MDAYTRSRNLIDKLRPHGTPPLGDAPLHEPAGRRERARLRALNYRIDELERLVDNEFATLEMAPFIAELVELTAARG